MVNKLMRLIFLIILIGLCSCRGDEYEIDKPDVITVAPGEKGEIKGFFLLNEGDMGSNKASLDYFDYESGTYYKNIYPAINPNIVHELGDVGNNIKIYGSNLYVVVNNSHLVEIMDVKTAKHKTAISILNCRHIVFDKGFAYVSSYNSPVKVDPDASLGCVIKIDTATMLVVDTCIVGYQPDEMAIRDNKLYVANSGGYRVPSYDSTISVINLNSFNEIKKIHVDINLHRLILDSDNNIYVSSRGNYKNSNSKTYVIDANDNIVKEFNLPCSKMTACGDSIYLYSVEWSQLSETNAVSYAIINTKTRSVVSRHFIKDGTEKNIKIPYAIAVNPNTKAIYVTDAKDYVTPGTLYCFSPEGEKKWSVITGDIPAHIVFTSNKLENLEFLNSHNNF